MAKTNPATPTTKPKVSKIRTKKKRWFPVLAPASLGQKEVGESYLTEAETALGRTLKINLKDITGSIYDQNIYVFLKVKEITGSNLQTDLIGYTYLNLFLKKLARRNIGKIEDSHYFRTKDDKGVRIKPLVVTAFGVNQSVKTAIRTELKKLLKNMVNNSTFDNLLLDVLRQKMRADFKKQLGKIFPIKELIIREIRLEEKKKKESPAEERSNSESEVAVEEPSDAAEAEEEEMEDVVLEEEPETK